MTESEYRAQLDHIDEELSWIYRRRRAVQAEFAAAFPPVLPPARARSEHQARVARCPRCSARLDSDAQGAKNGDH